MSYTNKNLDCTSQNSTILCLRDEIKNRMLQLIRLFAIKLFELLNCLRLSSS